MCKSYLPKPITHNFSITKRGGFNMKKDTILTISIYAILEFLNSYYGTFPTYALCELFKAYYPRITRFLLKKTVEKDFFFLCPLHNSNIL